MLRLGLMLAIPCLLMGASARPSLITAPMAFEPNRGQARSSADFVARGSRYTTLVQDGGAKLSVSGKSSTLEMEFIGTSPRRVVTADERQIGTSNYFIGNDRSRHITNVPRYSRITVHRAYPGIDLIYYGQQTSLEYDISVSPGADPNQVHLRFQGQKNLELLPDGNLRFVFEDGEWLQHRPVLYQLPERNPVEGRFTLAADGTVGFSIPAWDRTRTLIIDPVLTFATYLGAAGPDQADAVAVDSGGNIYVTGMTQSAGVPDVFLMKFNSTGTSILYSVFFGGATPSAVDAGHGIAVDSSNRVWVTGETSSTDFPTLANALGTACGSTAFLTRFSAAGNSVDFSICIPGTRSARAVRLDGSANIYVAGEAGGGIPIVNAAQAASGGSTDGFLGKLNSAATAWQYMTYLGGSNVDNVKALAVSNSGDACVGGSTWSTNFPTLNPRQAANASAGPIDAFVVKYNTAGTVLYSTYLGGTGFDEAQGAAIDPSGNCYVTGYTYSTDFPMQNAAQGSIGGATDAFVTAYNSNGSAYLYSTYLGGAQIDNGLGVAVTAAGVAHVVGDSSSGGFPVLHPLQAEIKDYGTVWSSANNGTTFTRSGLSSIGVNAVAVDPANAQNLYAGTTNGVYRSTNGGTSWTRSDTNWIYTNVTTLAIDPNDHCTIYAGLDAQTSLLNTNAALRSTTDCGATWTGIPVFTALLRSVNSISATVANPSVVYYAFERNLSPTTTERGIGRSTANGVDFTYPGPGGYYHVAADPANPCTAYATETIGTVYKNTTCAGFNWTSIGTDLGFLSAIAVHPTNQATVLVGNDQGAIYRKADAVSAFTQSGTLNGGVTSIVYHPTDPQTVYASTRAGGIYKSTNGGGSFSLVSSLTEARNLAVTPAAANNLYAGTAVNSDLFYTRLSASGALLDSTLLGGRGNDSARAVAVDGTGQVVIAGFTVASDFPVTGGVAVPAPPGGGDAFLLRIDPGTTPQVPVPNVVGMTKTSAINAITGAGLTVGTVSTAYSASVAAGNVIQYAQFLFSKSGISALNACYISYDPVANVFYLLSDDMTQWYGLLGGTANTIGNAQCTIYGATSGSTKAGTDLTTFVDISFRTLFAGTKSIYQFSGDTAGGTSGWQSMGTWNDSGDPNAVELMSLTPNSGNGASQIFTAVVRDGNGANTIAFAQLVMNATLSGFNGCFIHYDRASNVFFLLNDAGTAFSGLVGGSAGQVSNSQCTLKGTGSGGTVNGSNLTITYNLDFSAGFAGTKKIFMQPVDNTGVIEVWHQMGTWTR
jgi:hypothetical protein